MKFKQDLIVKFIFTTIICIQLAFMSHQIIDNQNHMLRNLSTALNNQRIVCEKIKVPCEFEKTP